jgi:hypothetical protein
MSGIGGLNETALHEELKRRYSGRDGQVEQEVDGFVVDVFRSGEIIEIQTSGLIRLRRKIELLRRRRAIRIVHPIAAITRIVKISATGEVISDRRSPKRGRTEELFRELVWIADLLPHRNVTVEVALVSVIETRADDGKGSWRRRGVSIVGRQLTDIVKRVKFHAPEDYLGLIPDGVGVRFTNRELCAKTGLSYRTVQPMTNSLRKMGLITVTAKEGREHVFERTR